MVAMRLRGGWGRGLTCAILGAMLGPTAAWAQAGFYVTPSVSMAEVYDDNVFNSPIRRESDFITRVTPDIQGGYRSPTFSLLGRYAFDAEVFTQHSELTDPQARQLASVEWQYLPTPTWTFSLSGGYQTTQTAGELNLQSGVQTGRVKAERISASPSVIYRPTAITTGTAEYMFTRDASAGTTTTTHAVTLGVERRLTDRDTATLRYAVRRFDFTTDVPSGGSDTITSHLVMIGWIRDLTPLTQVILRAGPRVSDGAVDPEAFVSIRRRLKFGEVSFTYERTQTTVIGQPGVDVSDGFAAALTYQPFAPLRVTASPAFFLSSGAGGEAKVYRAKLEASYQITRWVLLTGSYEFTLQQGTVGSVAGGQGEIQHNVVVLGLTFSYPYRIR